MTAQKILHAGRFRLSLDRPLVMGIVNVTPDSFSDGGRFLSCDSAVDHARHLIDEGADIIDIGGESTRPGAAAVSSDEELHRVIDVVEQLAATAVPISVDTRKPEVMRAAVAAGAVMVNDVNALRAPGAIDAVAATDAAVCLMHIRGTPASMQSNPVYADVVAEVRDYLLGRARSLMAAGVARERIVLDPGFGFGKTLEHNVALLRRLDVYASDGFPILAGVSRKSMIGTFTGRPANERLAGSVAAAIIAVQNGARIVRVHDVAATRDALAVLAGVESAANAGIDRRPEIR